MADEHESPLKHPASPDLPMNSRLRSSRRRVLAGLAVMLIAFVALDVVVGLTLCRGGRFGKWPLPPYSLTFNDKQRRSLEGDFGAYGGFDADLGWCAYPNGRRDDGCFIANSAGIRANREYAHDAPRGVTRIGAFGDSFTFSYEVSNNEMWTRLLEQSRPNLEVLNFGFGAYGTDQAYLRYLRDGKAFKPNIVLIGMMVENVQRNVTAYRPAYNHDAGLAFVKPRFRLDDTDKLRLVPNPAKSVEQWREMVESGRLLDTLNETDYWVRRAPLAYRESPLFWSSFGRLGYAAYENGGRRTSDYYQDTESEPFKVSFEILKTFRARAIADGAEQAVVLLFPDRLALSELLDDKPPYWEPMLKHLRAAQVPVWDVAPALAKAARSTGIDALFNKVHYSPKGEAVVAETLAAKLFGDTDLAIDRTDNLATTCTIDDPWHSLQLPSPTISSAPSNMSSVATTTPKCFSESFRCAAMPSSVPAKEGGNSHPAATISFHVSSPE